MANVRCPACFLTNDETQTICRRCGTKLAFDAGAGVWRDGPVLVVRQGMDLPGRCVRCNAPSRTGFLKTFYWHHPALYLLAPVALLLYAIIALLVRKKATVFVVLCPRHLSMRRWALAGSSLLVILGIVLLIVAIEGGAFFGWSGLAMILGGAIWGTLGSRGLAAKRIDDQFARFGGANADYLAQLPTWSAFTTSSSGVPIRG